MTRGEKQLGQYSLKENKVVAADGLLGTVDTSSSRLALGVYDGSRICAKCGVALWVSGRQQCIMSDSALCLLWSLSCLSLHVASSRRVQVQHSSS